jgi:hypothetical protein
MKCLVKHGHDPSRRERCDLRRHAAFGSSLPKTLSLTDQTVPYGTGCGWRVPGISCLATFIRSLRDNFRPLAMDQHSRFRIRLIGETERRIAWMVGCTHMDKSSRTTHSNNSDNNVII